MPADYIKKLCKREGISNEKDRAERHHPGYTDSDESG